VPGRRCLLKDVYQEYSWYCMQQDLAAVPRTNFMQYLIGKCELRVRTIWFERIHGLMWLKEPALPTEPLRPGSGREQVLCAFFEMFCEVGWIRQICCCSPRYSSRLNHRFLY